MFRTILKKVAPIPKLASFERYLFLGPHPDDIEVACSPTVRALTNAGKHVSFVVLTDGRMGAIDPKLFGDGLVEIRRREALASAKALGVDDVTFLPFHDGAMYSLEDAASTVAKEIVRLKPDAVFAPDPNVISECHLDHIKTGLAAKMAMNMAPFEGVMQSVGAVGSHAVKALAFYYTDKPNAYVPVKKTFSARAEALACHQSQFDEKTISDICMYFKLRSVRFGLRRLKGLCEGYRALSPTHMHCFPEASEWVR
ncbi:MAG: PIG-L deacetylase family protein [Eubacteriales bacterium]|nr:PIG-L deacetylase family protein [Eubacteriales bacterium]